MSLQFSNYSQADLDRLAEELLRVCGQKGVYNTFTIIDNPDYTATENGKVVQGATESEVIKHLTSRRDYVTGRQYRFPGVGNGWNFSAAIRDAGFRIVRARNYRNQPCTIVTL